MMIMFVTLVLSLSEAMAAYVHVDYDYKGATMAEAAYLALAKAEGLNAESIIDILDHYTSAEVASAGIWLSKFLERKALKDEMIFSSAENHYYKVILFLVTKRITPRMIRIGRELLHYPEQFLYWGPYLFKTSEDVMNLCAQFEAIVTNGKKGFSSSDFLQLSPALQEYFDFSKLGNVNWQEMWDRITNFPTPKWEDFREDFKELFGQVSPVNLAIAGEENIQGRATHIFDKFAEAPESLPELFDNVQEAFNEVTSGAAVKSILEGVIGDLKDSLAVEKLFDLGNYNVGNYINDYVNQLKGQFYTQLWYIYRVENNASRYYTQKYVIKQNGTEVYYMEYDSRSNKGDFDKKMTEMVAAYRKMYPDDKIEMVTEPRITKYVGYGQGSEVIVYDQLFDSRINHEVVFEKEFNQRIETLMKDQEVDYPWMKIEYKIGKGEKYYYEFESAETVRNTASASFTVNCHDEVELAKGGFNFKVNERYNSSKMNEYAYPKNMIPEKQPEDVTLWEEKIADLEKQIQDNKDLIAEYQQKITEIQAVADTTSNYTDRNKLLNEITSYRIKINNLNSTNIGLQDQLDEVNEVYENYQIDYNEDLDGPYRIPTLENDLAGDFHLHWDAAGSWSGHTYTRPAHIVGMEGAVKFIAEVKQERGEKRFLGIRYHRAIIGVEYRLVSEQETSETVDVIEFSDDMSDEEKANLINQKRQEVQGQFPSCNVTVVKSEKDPPEKEAKEEAFHLLWMSDRVALARFIEYRLRQIDGQLAFIERNLFIKRNVLDDFKKAFLQGVPRWRTSTPGGAALQRWLDISNGIAVNP
jgi:hypothetical protein